MDRSSSCNRVSDERKKCSCGSVSIIKNGYTKTQKQQYYCKNCGRRFIAFYSYKACRKSTDGNIIQLLKEGVASARLVWIVYALERGSREVVSFSVGTRTNKTLSVVLKTLTLLQAKRIYTDKLANYRYLIDKAIHRTEQYCTNHIERKNLTLDTHLKRLNRRTICFSRSLEMLRACLLIYFFS